MNDGRIVVGGMFDRINGELRGCIACIDTLGNLLNCWANGGLVPEAYTPGGGPYFQLFGFKCLSNGDCYIFGEYMGFIDANGLHPRQCLMSRMYMPDVGINHGARQEPLMHLYPNPCDATLHIDITEVHLHRAAISILDIQGRRVLQVTETAFQNSVDVSALPSGCYLLKMDLPDGRTFTKHWSKQ